MQLPTKQSVATAWFKLTGLRLKGRIKQNKFGGRVQTPYGVFAYEHYYVYGTNPPLVRFKSLELDTPPCCPLQPDVQDDFWENPEGDLEYVGPRLPHKLPRGYKKFQWVNGVAIATRVNGQTIVMGNQ